MNPIARPTRPGATDPDALAQPSRQVMTRGSLWLIALAVAATVTTFYDQWHQHLGFPWLWLREGSIHVIPRNFYSYMPVNSSLMYAYGLGSLGAWSAQAIHWWSGVVTVLSAGGAFVEVSEGFTQGSHVGLRFTLPGTKEEIVCGAIVRDNVPGRGIGVEFTQLADIDRERLRAAAWSLA